MRRGRRKEGGDGNLDEGDVPFLVFFFFGGGGENGILNGELGGWKGLQRRFFLLVEGIGKREGAGMRVFILGWFSWLVGVSGGGGKLSNVQDGRGGEGRGGEYLSIYCIVYCIYPQLLSLLYFLFFFKKNGGR